MIVCVFVGVLAYLGLFRGGWWVESGWNGRFFKVSLHDMSLDSMCNVFITHLTLQFMIVSNISERNCDCNSNFNKQFYINTCSYLVNATKPRHSRAANVRLIRTSKWPHLRDETGWLKRCWTHQKSWATDACLFYPKCVGRVVFVEERICWGARLERDVMFTRKTMTTSTATKIISNKYSSSSADALSWRAVRYIHCADSVRTRKIL